jgi:natural product biosynthesis luciferase-like monooxygenase protein
MFSIADNDASKKEPQRFYQELLDEIVLAEELGFEDYWVAEHHYSDYGIVPSPAVILAAAAARTSRIGLGCGVSILPFHSPMQAAEEYAMVDMLSNGRLIMGVGRGFLAHEYQAFGIQDQEESREKFDEALEIIMTAWKGERFSFCGKHYRVDDLQLNVRPVQGPRPPIYLAAVTPSSYEKAARLGISVAGVIATMKTLDKVAERLDSVKRLYADHGYDPAAVDLPLTWYTFVVPDKETAYDQAGRHLVDYFRSVATILDPDRVDDPESKKVYQGLQEWNLSVTYEHIQQQTDVALIGDPDMVIQKLKRAEQAGLEKVHCFMNFGTRPHEEVVASMKLFAAEVMPALR